MAADMEPTELCEDLSPRVKSALNSMRTNHLDTCQHDTLHSAFAQPPTHNTSHFLDLPAELRLVIYSHLGSADKNNTTVDI
jgi:hypothetical protein